MRPLHLRHSSPRALAHACGVHYQWSAPDGTICQGRTIVTASTHTGLRQAAARFFRQNPHIAPINPPHLSHQPHLSP